MTSAFGRGAGARGGAHARLSGVAAAAAFAGLAAIAAPARGDPPPPRVLVDRTAVRFYAPETGGAAYPRFVSQRTLAFEARLALMADTPDGIGDGYDARDVEDALEHHVAEELLASLADRLIADSPPDRRPTPADLASVEQQVAAAVVERTGGRARIDAAARAEQLDGAEVDALLRRTGLAAWYIDRAVTPILHPTEEQLRDVLRTSANPYRGRRFSQVRGPLERWFVVERVRAAESAFLQGARARVHVISTR